MSVATLTKRFACSLFYEIWDAMKVTAIRSIARSRFSTRVKRILPTPIGAHYRCCT